MRPTIQIIILAIVLLITPSLATALEGYGQMTLNNQASATADLYVDGAYGCRALARLFCTTQVRVGNHDLEAKLTDGRTINQNGVEVGQGESRTWTIMDN